MSKRGFIRGALLGGAIAGALALLFAPKAGDETRKELAKKAKQVGDKIAKQLETFKSSDFAKRNSDLINRAELLRGKLADRAEQYSKASKKVTKTAAHETAKLIDEGKDLLEDLKVAKRDITKKGAKITKKAAKSAQKIVTQTKNQLANKSTSKPAKK